MKVKLIEKYFEVLYSIYCNGNIDYYYFTHHFNEIDEFLNKEKDIVIIGFTDQETEEYKNAQIPHSVYFANCLEKETNKIFQFFQNWNIKEYLYKDNYKTAISFINKSREVILLFKHSLKQDKTSEEGRTIIKLIIDQIEKLEFYVTSRLHILKDYNPDHYPENILPTRNDTHKKIQLNLTVEEIGCLIALMYLSDIFKTKLKKSISNVFVQCFSSQNAENISNNNLYNSILTKEFDPANYSTTTVAKIKESLRRMRELLK